ncbi:histidine kinase [Mycobacterium sp. 852013-50091_SCH5140682]|uniref:sensor histidine kinase n=1 Tax=Mycobacterium sp. 852013-50091_SCH5140682 TaxID=1834109 RepID=UPI0007E9E804|nr:histidine kinase [Mycobacterium sp. 852013-50091_SCH5140682]OBC01795.1 histidine kinase [Mycobacterium sp. 852013-50091_SCH5140682]
MADGELSDARRSLARQSLVIALLAATVDVGIFASSGIFQIALPEACGMAALLVAADLALALPTRLTVVVAVGQAVTRLSVCWLLSRHGLAAGIGDVGILVAGYRVGAWLPIRVAVFVVPVLAAAVSGAAMINGAARTWREVLLIAISNAVVPWLVGRYTAAGRAYVDQLERQQQRQQAAMERALADEREAIARDLHDVIAHHVSAVGIHAGAARLALGNDPDTVAQSLGAVESASRSAMMDLRRQLDLLHGADGAGERQPGLANVSHLADTVRAAGLSADVTLPDAAPGLSPSLDVTVYRIVQELLTNALRHGAGTARLQVRCTNHEVIIEASNPIGAQGTSPESTGRGRSGIRRRAELFGGTVRDGSDDGSLWRTKVSIPIPPS